MLIEEGLFAFLSTDTGVNVTAGIGRRIYGNIAPQNAVMPCIVYTKITQLESQTLCGTDNLVRALLQIDCYAKEYKEAKQVAKAVKTLLRDYKGLMGTVRTRNTILDNEVDLGDPEPGLSRVSQTFFTWYYEE